MAYVIRHKGQVMTASGLDVLAGIWLLISPFVLRFSYYGLTQATTNNVILGIVIGVLAAIRFFGAYRESWLSWINAVLGLWVLLSPWILRFSHNSYATTNNVILGIVVIVLASWSALATEASTNRPMDRTVDRGDMSPMM
jgi:4-amino-4-deoxy-L-arabinose transferase-like glycosyltransferase